MYDHLLLSIDVQREEALTDEEWRDRKMNTLIDKYKRHMVVAITDTDRYKEKQIFQSAKLDITDVAHSLSSSLPTYHPFPSETQRKFSSGTTL